jgi:hypothetical protein
MDFGDGIFDFDYYAVQSTVFLYAQRCAGNLGADRTDRVL